MKISYNWLKQYINININAEELSALLTSCGLEVEAFEETESIKGGLRGLVIGEVLQKEKHPDADRLSVTQVNVGKDEVLQIVCGAANVAAGQKVLVALPGARLYPTFGEPFEIKKSKIRGQESSGMICAEDEVGLGKGHAGIMVLDSSAVPGTPASKYFKVEEDYIFEIGLTPNRADAASHIGVARDVMAVINTRNTFEEKTKHDKVVLSLPDISKFNTDKKTNAISVSVEDADACIRYSGATISGIKIAVSPDWLKNRLLSIGLKPINNVVDITNFVMFETGQPLHAFDSAKITGNKIVIKKIAAQTKFKTLDGVERKLFGDELMICNTNEAMCMAGVYGGIDSGVTETIKEIFLESACFHPASIRKASRLHALKTDSSFRFERGTDVNATVFALKRAALLIKEIAGGEITSDVIDVYPNKVDDAAFFVSYQNVKKLSGIDFKHEVIKEVLENTGIKIESENEEGVQITVPAYKVDVKREADVVEEIVRIYGYDHIPLPDKFNFSFSTHRRDVKHQLQKNISLMLAANGFTEIFKNSLSNETYLEKFSADEKNNAVHILNPLSNELNILRTGLLFTSLEAIQYNVNRKSNDLKFFEFGKTYSKTEKGFNEQNKICLVATGNIHTENWHKQNNKSSLFFLKSVVENVIMQISKLDSHRLQWKQNENNLLLNFAEITFNRNAVGIIGSARKNILKHFDISQEVFFAELDFDALMRLANEKIKITEAPKFPEVKRDLSMILDTTVKYSDIRNLAFQSEKKLLKDVTIFDVYDGDKVTDGKKSYALSFVLRDDEKTLEDKNIDAVMNKLISVFETKIGAVVRK